MKSLNKKGKTIYNLEVGKNAQTVESHAQRDTKISQLCCLINNNFVCIEKLKQKDQ